MSFNPTGSEPNKLPGLPPRKPAAGTPGGPPGLPNQETASGSPSGGFKPLPGLGGVSKPAPVQTPQFTRPEPVQPRFQAAPQPVAPQQTEQPVDQQPQQVQQQAPQPVYQQMDYGQQPQQGYVQQQQPVYNNAPQLVNTAGFDNLDEEDEDETPRKGFGRKKPAPNKRAKTEKTKKGFKTKKQSAYAGKRKGVMVARIAVFGIVGLLAIAGVNSFLPKSTGLTAGDGPLILSKVRENLNFTDFPRVKGEGIAQAFTAVYLTYDPAGLEARKLALQQYVDPALLPKLEPRPATKEEIAQAKSEKAVVDIGLEEGTDGEGSTDPNNQVDVPAGGNEPIAKQTITAGPYVIGSTMFKGGAAAIFTTMTQVNNNNWIYLDIPIYYDKTADALSISGSVTFSTPLETATVPSRENSTDWGDTDREIQQLMAEDIGNFFKAWTASDTPNIERFLVKKDGQVVATATTQEGLGGKVQVVGITKFEVQGKQKPEDGATTAEVEDYRTRQADVTVTFLEPTSNLIYAQTYRLVLKYVNDDWFIEDIDNISVLLDRDLVIKQAEADQN